MSASSDDEDGSVYWFEEDNGGDHIFYGSNYELSLEPGNISIIERLKLIKKKLQKGMSSLPSTLSEERKTNLFLIAENVEKFTMLRKHKDRWKC